MANPGSAIRNPTRSAVAAAVLAALAAGPAFAQETAPAAPDADGRGREAPPTATDYFPLVRGSTWTYATNLEQGDLMFDAVGVETIIDQPHVIVILSLVQTVDGKRMEKPFQREWFRKTPAGDVVCPKRMIGKDEVAVDPPQVHVKAGLAPGMAWSWQGRLEHGSANVSYAVEAEETVRVPAGEFKALRLKVVSTAESGTATVTRWLAPGVGMVKEEAEVAFGARGPVKTIAELKSYRIGPEIKEK